MTAGAIMYSSESSLLRVLVQFISRIRRVGNITTPSAERSRNEWYSSFTAKLSSLRYAETVAFLPKRSLKRKGFCVRLNLSLQRIIHIHNLDIYLDKEASHVNENQPIYQTTRTACSENKAVGQYIPRWNSSSSQNLITAGKHTMQVGFASQTSVKTAESTHRLPPGPFPWRMFFTSWTLSVSFVRSSPACIFAAVFSRWLMACASDSTWTNPISFRSFPLKLYFKLLDQWCVLSRHNCIASQKILQTIPLPWGPSNRGPRLVLFWVELSIYWLSLGLAAWFRGQGWWWWIWLTSTLIASNSASDLRRNTPNLIDSERLMIAREVPQLPKHETRLGMRKFWSLSRRRGDGLVGLIQLGSHQGREQLNQFMVWLHGLGELTIWSKQSPHLPWLRNGCWRVMNLGPP